VQPTTDDCIAENGCADNFPFCTGINGDETGDDPSLFDQLDAAVKNLSGDTLDGSAALMAVLDQFILNVVADEAINCFFAGATDESIAALKQNLHDQMCEAWGGPCTYVGGTMQDVHAGMGVGDSHYWALVDDLNEATKAVSFGALGITLDLLDAENDDSGLGAALAAPFADPAFVATVVAQPDADGNPVDAVAVDYCQNLGGEEGGEETGDDEDTTP